MSREKGGQKKAIGPGQKKKKANPTAVSLDRFYLFTEGTTKHRSALKIASAFFLHSFEFFSEKCNNPSKMMMSERVADTSRL